MTCKTLLTLILCGLSACCVNTVASTQAASSRAKKPGNRHEQRGRAHEVQEPTPRKDLSIPDVSVVNQEGREIKFYTDLVKDKVVLINFIYTTCEAACPMSGERFAKLQTALGDRVGKDVYLISISTDPETDTPAKLKTWGRRFDAGTGWTFITGGKTEMTALLRALTGSEPRKDFHLPAAYVINNRSGDWVYTSLLQSPDRLLKTIDDLVKQQRRVRP
jgi:protein SCO1/2